MLTDGNNELLKHHEGYQKLFSPSRPIKSERMLSNEGISLVEKHFTSEDFRDKKILKIINLESD